MQEQIALRRAALAAALATIAATAWAATELTNSTWIPAPRVTTDTSTRVMPLEAAAIPREVAPTTEPLPPSNEHTPAANEEPPVPPIGQRAPAAPRLPLSMERSAAQAPITIEERRLTLDERIQADVIDMLAKAPNLSGKIGVESRDAVVTLSGWTTTAGQARRAVRYAYNVNGVKSVQNEIRARVGGSI